MSAPTTPVPEATIREAPPVSTTTTPTAPEAPEAPSPAAATAPRKAGVLPVALMGLGTALPERVVTNDDLAKTLDTSDEWIASRTGIRQRHIAGPDESTSDLAVRAGQAALDDAGIAAEDIALVIVATTTPDHSIPGSAPNVASRLGMKVPAFDINAACSGFVYGLQVAGAMVATGSGPILLIGSDTLTRIVDYSERTTAVLFGDGAGATVLVASDDAALGPFTLGADGEDPAILWAESSGSRKPQTPESIAAGEHFLTMRGGEVYRGAVTQMTATCQDVLAQAGMSTDEVDLFVGHQANARILKAVASRLDIPDERCHLTVDQHGNTSAASIPLALADARDNGRLQSGDRLLLTAFGAGLTWGSCVLTWT